MRFLPAFLSGCAIGAAVCAGLVRLREPAPPPVPAAAAPAATTSPRESILAAQVDRLEKQVDRLQKDLIAARAEAKPAGAPDTGAKAVTATAQTADTTPAGSAQPAVPDFLKGLISSLPSNAVVTVNGQPSSGGGIEEILQGPMRNQAVKSSAARARYYSSTLGLTPEQEKQLGEHFLEGQANDLNDLPRLIQQQMAKAMNPEAAEKAEREQLAAILPPAQLQAFDQMRESERRAAAEADALVEVARVRRAVPDLSEQQREQVYARALEKGPARPLAALTPEEADEPDPYEDLLSPAQRMSYEALSESNMIEGAGATFSTKTIVIPSGR